MGKLIKFAINRPVTVLMIFLGIVFLGIISLRELSVDLLPTVQYPRLSVITTYLGAGPEEVENFITAPLESYLSTVPGIRKLKSVSREGISVITLEFEWGTNMDFTLVHTREKLDSARYVLPQGAGRPRIIQYDPQSRPINLLAISGPFEIKELDSFSREIIKPRLEQIQGVASAEILGGIEREIQVDINPELLTLYNLTIEEVSKQIDSFNKDFQGGRIKKGKFEYSLRVSGELRDLAEIGDIPVKVTKKGELVRLKDIAKIKESLKEREGFTKLNGEECLGIAIYKESGANTLKVTKEVKKILSQIKNESHLINIQIILDESRYIENSISSLKGSIAVGAILVFIVLLLFLQNLKDSINIGIAIPIAVIATFNLLYFRNITLNIMSLGGLALGIGMFVENSIVVVESIHRAKSAGHPIKEASYLGTMEVAMPIVAAIFTTIAVFFPVVYIHGVAGQLFKDQALTVSFSLLSSLLAALLLLPMLSSREWKIRLPEETEKSKEEIERNSKKTPILLYPFKGISLIFGFLGKIISFLLSIIISSIITFFRLIFSNIIKFIKPFYHLIFVYFNKGYNRFYEFYHKVLIWCLDNKGKTLSITLLIFALAVISFFSLKKELMPKSRTSFFRIELETPLDFSLSDTYEVVTRIEEEIKKDKDLEYIFSQTGFIGEALLTQKELAFNTATIVGKVKEWKKLQGFIERTRNKLKHFPITGSIKEEETTLASFLAFEGRGLEVKLFGEDLERMKSISEEAIEGLSKINGIVDLRTNIGEGKPELLVKIKKDSLEKFNITPYQLGTYIIDVVRGKSASQFKEFDKRIDISVRSEEREKVERLLNLKGYFNGNIIPLRELIYIEEGSGPSEIRRENQKRVIFIEGNLSRKKLSDIVPEITKTLKKINLPENFRFEMGGEEEEIKESFRSLRFAFLLASFLVFMILASQFESLVHPFIIILTIPMGLIGVIWALFLTSQSINVISIIGAIVVSGIVVNDAIVKVDYMNYCRKMGMSVREAILTASEEKVRPVVMNTITDVFGVLPTAIFVGEGTELQQPLAIAFAGGLIVATFLTIFLIPVIYEIFERKKNESIH